jgi:hypothetical protein
MATARSKQLASALTRLAADTEGLGGEPARALLQEALASRDQRSVSQAATLIAERALAGHEASVVAAYQELSGERAGSDPGCSAKEALLWALDALEHSDAELFARAAAHTQVENVKGKRRESAGGVRARGLLGLARLGHQDLSPILGAGLGDDDGAVRLAAARAIGHRRQRELAGLLLVKLGAGDVESEVLVECLRGLLALAPDFGLPKARTLLERGGDARELALQALGSAADDNALELLNEELRGRVLAAERQDVIDALSLSRRPRARAILLDLLASGSATDAEAALAALSIHSYDASLVEQVRQATQHSTALSRRFAELYGAA